MVDLAFGSTRPGQVVPLCHMQERFTDPAHRVLETSAPRGALHRTPSAHGEAARASQHHGADPRYAGAPPGTQGSPRATAGTLAAQAGRRRGQDGARPSATPTAVRLRAPPR